jgi:hypothetical protein
LMTTCRIEMLAARHGKLGTQSRRAVS